MCRDADRVAPCRSVHADPTAVVVVVVGGVRSGFRAPTPRAYACMSTFASADRACRDAARTPEAGGTVCIGHRRATTGLRFGIPVSLPRGPVDDSPVGPESGS